MHVHEFQSGSLGPSMSFQNQTTIRIPCIDGSLNAIVEWKYKTDELYNTLTWVKVKLKNMYLVIDDLPMYGS